MMRFRNKATFTAVLAILVLVLALGTGCQSAGAKDNTTPKTNAAVDSAKTLAASGDQTSASSGISVTGQGTVTIKPDVATVSLGVQTVNADAGKARKANDEAMAKVLAAIKGFGIADGDITTSNFSIYPQYDNNGTKITGYTVSNTVTVKVKALDKLGDVLTAATAAGANTAGGVSFDVQDRTAAYNQALAQAMAKAKTRADAMAKACGVTAGKVLSINETSSYSGPVYAGRESLAGDKAAAVPVSAGTLEVTASVSVVYEIVK